MNLFDILRVTRNTPLFIAKIVTDNPDYAAFKRLGGIVYSITLPPDDRCTVETYPGYRLIDHINASGQSRESKIGGVGFWRGRDVKLDLIMHWMMDISMEKTWRPTSPTEEIVMPHSQEWVIIASKSIDILMSMRVIDGSAKSFIYAGENIREPEDDDEIHDDAYFAALNAPADD